MTQRRSEIVGIRFIPSNLELVTYYLYKRVKEHKTFCFIPDKDVYEREPWLLQHVTHSIFKPNVWYYFFPRKKVSKETSRVVGDFTWESNGLSEICDKNKVKVGVMQSLTFLRRNGTKEEATGWIMYEYLLDEPKFQHVVLCKIKFRPGEGNALYAPRLEP